MSGNFVTKWISWYSLVLKGNIRGDYVPSVSVHAPSFSDVLYVRMEFKDIYFCPVRLCDKKHSPWS